MTETSYIPTRGDAAQTGACAFFACLAYPHSWVKRDHYILAFSDYLLRSGMTQRQLKRVPKGRTLHMQRQQQDRAMADGLERIKDRERAWKVAKWYAIPSQEDVALGPFDTTLYFEQDRAKLRGDMAAEATGRRVTRSIKRASLAQAIATAYSGASTVRITLRLPTESVPGAMFTTPTGPQATTAQIKNFIRDVWTPSKPVLHMIAAAHSLNQQPIDHLIAHPDDWLRDTLSRAETYRRILTNTQFPDGSIVWPTLGEMIRLLPRE